jgi:hypothetical protein
MELLHAADPDQLLAWLVALGDFGSTVNANDASRTLKPIEVTPDRRRRGDEPEFEVAICDEPRFSDSNKDQAFTFLCVHLSGLLLCCPAVGL